MKMEEQKLKTIQSLADLLRESTRRVGVLNMNTGITESLVHNDVFSPEEHETVKRKFLHLLNSL